MHHPTPKTSFREPVPFQGDVCEEFDAAVKLIIHVIKQAIDDYTLGKTCTIVNKKKRNQVNKKALDAKTFLYSADMQKLLRVIGFHNKVNLSYLTKMLEQNTHRRFNRLTLRT